MKFGDITRILLGDCMVNFVQYGACLLLSMHNVLGAHFFLVTQYRHIEYVCQYISYCSF